MIVMTLSIFSAIYIYIFRRIMLSPILSKMPHYRPAASAVLKYAAPHFITLFIFIIAVLPTLRLFIIRHFYFHH